MLGTNKQLGGSVAAETSACDNFIPCLARPEEEKGTYGKRTSGRADYRQCITWRGQGGSHLAVVEYIKGEFLQVSRPRKTTRPAIATATTSSRSLKKFSKTNHLPQNEVPR